MPCKQLQVTDIVATHHFQISKCAKGTQLAHTDPLTRLGWECSGFMDTLYQMPNVKGNEVAVHRRKMKLSIYIFIFCIRSKSNYSICFLYVNDLKMANKG